VKTKATAPKSVPVKTKETKKSIENLSKPGRTSIASEMLPLKKPGSETVKHASVYNGNPVKDLLDSGLGVSEKELQAKFALAYKNFLKYKQREMFNVASSGTHVTIADLFGLCAVESACNPYSPRSGYGARGEFQILPSTAQELGCGTLTEGSAALGNWRESVLSSSRCAVKFISSNMNLVVGGSQRHKVNYVLASYETGWGAYKNARMRATKCGINDPKSPLPVEDLVRKAVYRTGLDSCPGNLKERITGSDIANGYYLKISAYRYLFLKKEAGRNQP
jgi:hypothetical protein